MRDLPLGTQHTKTQLPIPHPFADVFYYMYNSSCLTLSFPTPSAHFALRSRQKAGLGGSQQPRRSLARRLQGRLCRPRSGKPGLRCPPGGLASNPRGLTALVARCHGSLRGILPGADQAAQTLHCCPGLLLLLLLSQGKGPQAGVPREVSCSGPDKPVPRTPAYAAGPNTPLRAHLHSTLLVPVRRGRVVE